MHELDEGLTFLYTPLSGDRDVRAAWLQRQRRIAGNPTLKVGYPVMTHGLTHAISILATLFSDPETSVIIADPFWENYKLLFSLYSGASVSTYPAFHEGTYNVKGLRQSLARSRGKKTVVVLNLPGNPTGYTPRKETIPEIVKAISEHPEPLVVIIDDAYQGTQYEPGLMARSCFWDIAEAVDPAKVTVFKVDGATKELFFFSGRVGFITSNQQGEAENALLSKIMCIIRGTVGSAPGPSQAMILKALEDPSLEEQIQARHSVIAERYRALKSCLEATGDQYIRPYPFNSAYFGILGLPEGVSANTVRQRLIEEESIGTIYLPSINALRVAYCSIDKSEVSTLVESIERVVRSSL